MQHRIVSRDQWLQERTALLAKEKELTADAKKELAKLEGKWTAQKVLVEDREETPPDGQKIVEFKASLCSAIASSPITFAPASM